MAGIEDFLPTRSKIRGGNAGLPSAPSDAGQIWNLNRPRLDPFSTETTPEDRTSLNLEDTELRPRPQESDCVESLEYDTNLQELTINFWERGSYKYFGFSAEAFTDFNNASSRGGHFNANIRNAGYAYERIA